MSLCLLLGAYLSALLLVDAVVVDLMLLCIHVLGSVIDDITCIVEQIAYAYDDLCVEIVIDRPDCFLGRLVSLLGKVEFIENAEGVMTGIKPLVASGAGLPVLIAGIFAGLGIGLSALFQGRAGAGACDAQAETNQGFTNYLAALGIVETVAIFTMVFALIALGKIA